MAAPSSQRPAATIDCLPPELLVRCLQPLSIKDRLASAAPVCRHWAAAATAPELLSGVKADFGRGIDIRESPAAMGTAAASRARSLLRWLHRHSHAVHSLELRVGVPDSCSPLQQAELTAQFDGCVAACNAEELALVLLQSQAAALGSWAQHLRSLRALVVSVWGGQLQLLASLEYLGRLVRLSISANQLLVGDGVSLPTSLTELRMDARSVAGSFQVPMLHRLSSLALTPSPAAAALGGLRLLANVAPSLTKLDLLDCSLEQSSLPSGLQVLVVKSMMRELDSGSLTTALRQLKALTGFGVHDIVTEPAAVLLGSLSALSRLRWLYLHSSWDQHRGLALPSGTWLGSLRHWACMSATVLRNQHLLQLGAAVSPLTRISLLDEPMSWSSQDWRAACSLLAGLPNLSRLDCLLEEEDGTYPYAPVELLHACTQLAIRKPSIQLHIVPFEFEWPLNEMLEMPREDALA